MGIDMFVLIRISIEKTYWPYSLIVFIIAAANDAIVQFVA